MALFDFLKFRPRNKAFISPEKASRNMENQLSMAPRTLAQLRQLSVSTEKELRLEYFFYTNTAGKAAQLTTALADLGYSAQYGTAAGDKNQFVITGWTTAIKMADDIVGEWVRQMCTLGARHDCEFDGWGTDPGQ